jgi:hypothetical protein
MADINVQHAVPTSLRCRCKDGLADATVMDWYEGCAWGRRVGKGREACLSWASVPECDTRLCVRAFASPGSGEPTTTTSLKSLDAGRRLAGALHSEGIPANSQLRASVPFPSLSEHASCPMLGRGSSMLCQGACLQLHLGGVALVRGVVSDGQEPGSSSDATLWTNGQGCARAQGQRMPTADDGKPCRRDDKEPSMYRRRRCIAGRRREV